MTTIRTSLSGTPPAMLDRELRSAVAGMSRRLRSVPKAFRHFVYDVTRTEKRARPFGQYPDYAATLARAGVPISDIAAPLDAMRGWLVSLVPAVRCIATALINAAKEQGEALMAGMKLMRQADRPTDAALDEYIREATEARDYLNASIDTAYALRWGKAK